MNIVGSVVVAFLVVVLIHDFNSCVLKNSEKIKAEAAKVNGMPTDGAKIIIIVFIGWLTVSLGVLFAGVYLWIASMGILQVVGIALALLNLTYMFHHIGYLVQFKLPDSFPVWWRWAVAVEVVLGVPYLLYALTKLIGG